MSQQDDPKQWGNHTTIYQSNLYVKKGLKMNKRFKYSISAIVFALLATFAMSDSTFAQATTEDGAESAVTEDGRRGRRGAGRGHNRGPAVDIRLTQEERQELMAEAFGMSVEELEAAHAELKSAMQAAVIAKVQDAVEAGDLTQEQADAIIERIESRGEASEEGESRRGEGRRGKGRRGGSRANIRLTQEEKQALKADVFDMSVEEMDAAKEALRAAMKAAQIEKIQAAVEAGELTQERADAIIERIESRGERGSDEVESAGRPGRGGPDREGRGGPGRGGPGSGGRR